MKRVMILLITFMVMVSVVSCGSAKKANTPENSLAWEGSYSGLVPGANSEILTNLTLTREGEFQLEFQYIDKSDEIFTENGTFSWNRKGTTITLTTKHFPSQYVVEDNKLTQLDMEGKTIKGAFADHYILTKN